MPDASSVPPTEQSSESLSGTRSSRRAKWFYGLALVAAYLVALYARLPVASFDEPDLTYGDEAMTIGQAENLLRNPAGRIEHFHKAPGVPHFLYLTFRPYYWLTKGYFGWQSLNEVQWWRVRHFWRALDILLGSLTIFLAGMIGARVFNRRVGLLAAALCAASSLCSVWFSFMKEEGLMALAVGIVIYAACRLFSAGSRRFLWIMVAGLATGSALAFKYTAAPVVIFFLLALFFSNVTSNDSRKTSNWLSRFCIVDIVSYGLSSAATFLAWFPQLIMRPNDVWASVTTLPQIQCLNIGQLKIPPVRVLLSVAWATWKDSFWRGVGLGDTYPLYFFILMTVILVVMPLYAIVRRHRFVLALSAFAWLTYLIIYYQWLFSGWRFRHYFLPAIIPIYLLVAYGLDLVCGKVATWVERPTGFRFALLPPMLLLALSVWPVWVAYGVSRTRLATIRSSVGGVEKSRALRREIVRNMPVGARVFSPASGRACISDALLDNRYYYPWRREEWEDSTWDDLVRQGFDFVAAESYPLSPQKQKPVYLKELTLSHVKPFSLLPSVSHLYGRQYYIPVQRGGGESFNLGLYFREPSAGDFAGVRGRIPPLPGQEDRGTTQNLILKLRLYNGEKWYPKVFRWEVLLDGKTLWHGRDTTETKQASLSLPIPARPGAEILIRNMRTDYQQEITWGWGGPPSHFKMDGLQVIPVGSQRPLAIKWTPTGRNGGPGPSPWDGHPVYAMRTDWLHNDHPVALRDTDFEGSQPLVDAWRPYQIIEPRDQGHFPEQEKCRKMARIEKAVGAGLNGSDALRFIVAYPAKAVARLGIMQPIVYPDAQQVRTIRVHYRTDGDAANRIGAALRLAATGLSLSGQYIDHAEKFVALPPAASQWNTAELHVEKAWKLEHTRVDLIDFLEVAIEVISGRDAVFNCLIDQVELK